jgi:hypothetical protein
MDQVKKMGGEIVVLVEEFICFIQDYPLGGQNITPCIQYLLPPSIMERF